MATTVIEFAAELGARRDEDPEFNHMMVSISGQTLFLLVDQLARTMQCVERLEAALTSELKIIERDRDGRPQALRTLTGPYSVTTSTKTIGDPTVAVQHKSRN